MQQTPTTTYLATAVLVLIVLVIGGTITGMILSGENTETQEDVSSFEECVEAGNRVMESYPEKCRTEDGRTFTRDVGNVLEKTDMVQVTAPRPGDEVGQTFTVEGQARGPWFFEASFAVFVESEAGEQIGGGIATAQGEWMTEEFVPFEAEISLDETYAGRAQLILEKQNASGLPENVDSVYFPITISAESEDDNGDTVSEDGCYVGGCSGQVCSDSPDVATTCEWRPEYACYEDATCERQDNDECGWTETEALRSCLESGGGTSS